MSRDANVKVVLSANDQASGPLKNFQNTIRGVKSEMGGLDDALGNLAGGAGKQWGQSFLNTVAGNVPLELIFMLSNLVTPQVRAALAADASLTGPTE